MTFCGDVGPFCSATVGLVPLCWLVIFRVEWHDTEYNAPRCSTAGCGSKGWPASVPVFYALRKFPFDLDIVTRLISIQCLQFCAPVCFSTFPLYLRLFMGGYRTCLWSSTPYQARGRQISPKSMSLSRYVASSKSKCLDTEIGVGEGVCNEAVRRKLPRWRDTGIMVMIYFRGASRVGILVKGVMHLSCYVYKLYSRVLVFPEAKSMRVT